MTAACMKRKREEVFTDTEREYVQKYMKSVGEWDFDEWLHTLLRHGNNGKVVSLKSKQSAMWVKARVGARHNPNTFFVSFYDGPQEVYALLHLSTFVNNFWICVDTPQSDIAKIKVLAHRFLTTCLGVDALTANIMLTKTVLSSQMETRVGPFGHFVCIADSVHVEIKFDDGASAALKVAERDVLLQCPYRDKEIAKALGAKWDAVQRKWYIPQGCFIHPVFSTWLC